LASIPELFNPFTLASLTLRNRVAVSPMCQYSAQEGTVTDWHLVHLGARAAGGAALVVAEATAVSPEGRITNGCAGLWSDGHIEPWARVTRFIKAQGAVPGIQIAHAGRKGSSALPWDGGAHLDDDNGGWPTIAPSAMAFGETFSKVPTAMTQGDIDRVKDSFKSAASRAYAAGHEWLELHAAHGYLIHEFLSPLSNQRVDAYGGSFENRIRFLMETTRAVRGVWPERLPLTVRLSCSDWVTGGWDIEQSVELSRRLKAEGVLLIDCSSGGVVPNAKIPVRPGYNLLFSERIRREVSIATAVVGLITLPKQANEIIRDGQADLIYMAREFIREPNWALHAAKELGSPDAVRPPKQYARGW
jgi:2,4-dienoyl-CoA reductase-like NADH-dependent reductase (Old Yellow Enzyme family)